MARYKMLVASCVPDPEHLSTEPVHLPAGTVVELSEADAVLALAQGISAPFDSDHGCPECITQGRPCTVECFRGLGGKDEEYFPAMVAHEDRKREASFLARSQEPSLPPELSPGDPIPSDTTPTLVPDLPQDPPSPPRASRRPAST
jgi:hypothetical protein